jgi:ribosomal protein L11 methyltransferase
MANLDYHIITLTIEQNLTDITHGILHDLGCQGSEELDEADHLITIKAYFDDQKTIKELIESIEKEIPKIKSINGNTINLGHQRFQPQPFEPIKLIDDYWIIPPSDMQEGLEIPKGNHLIIRPGMAFGTGRHETTMLASQLIAKLNGKSSFLDVGSGSGILAILAHQLGFKKIVAVEIDEQSHSNCRENFEHNQLPEIPLYKNIEDVREKFDVVVANIVTPTLIYLHDALKNHLKEDGYLVLSGILDQEFEQIVQKYNSFEIIEHLTKNEWMGAILKKSS